MNSSPQATLREKSVDLIRRACGYRFPALGLTVQTAVRRLLPQNVSTELHPRITARLDLADETQRSTWWRGDRFEAPTADVLWRLAAHERGVFFDIGSNYGFFTWYLVSQRRDLTVHAFEANPSTFKKFEEIRLENGLERVKGWNLGLADSEGTLALHRGTADSGHSTFANHPELTGSGQDMVRVAPFDAWRREARLELPDSPIWVAKIDVEGFELKVLHGMKDSLQARAFAGLVVEINPFTLNLTKTNPVEIHDYMAAFGYRDTSGLPPETEHNAFFELSAGVR